jgi:diguanylate cyclase (GGDEF)-like protein
MMRITPTLKIALALVFLTCAMLVLINSLLQVFPDPDAQLMRERSLLAQSIAAQAATLAQQHDQRGMEQLLTGIREHNAGLRSLAAKRVDNTVIAQTTDHDAAWGAAAGEEATLTHIAVPVSAGSERWGRIEVAFAAPERNFIQRVLMQPLWATLLSVIPLGLLFYWIYMKRALVHLDPSAVIPQRVRLAFNVMTEGVAVLDRHGRILLANNALLALSTEDPVEPVGKALSALPWLGPSLPAAAAEHPWNLAMAQGKPITNQWIELHAASATGRKLVVNCAPIADERGVVRGCLATFDDLTELHQANEQLSKALTELQTSQEEIEVKNRELEHLATHDVLTGCLTRRAFFDRMSRAFDDARSHGAPLSCVVLDIDRSKSVNDTLGHAVGDQVVQEVGRQLLAAFRNVDIVGRCGGDEFFIGMPGCDVAAAAQIAETMRRAIEHECAARVPGIAGLAVSISAGLAALDASDATLAHLLERADLALYAAKTAGRNRVAMAEAPQKKAGVVHA